MKVRIRSKANGVLEVSDESGNRIDGVVSVEMPKTAVGDVPRVTIVCEAEVVVDADAETKKGSAKKNPAHEAYHGPASDWPANKDK